MNRARIAVIDDDLDILAGTSLLLSSKYHVTTFDDGRAALEFLQRRPVDLILLDLMMPKIGGAQFLAEMDLAHLQIPVIVMTASSNCHRVLKDSHFSGLVRKPFSIEELETAIESTLALNKLASAAPAF